MFPRPKSEIGESTNGFDLSRHGRETVSSEENRIYCDQYGDSLKQELALSLAERGLEKYLDLALQVVEVVATNYLVENVNLCNYKAMVGQLIDRITTSVCFGASIESECKAYCQLASIIAQKVFGLEQGVYNKIDDIFVITFVMFSIESEPLKKAVKRVDPQLVNQAFDEIIDDLRANWRVSQPTKYEQVLEVFRTRISEVVSINELTPIFENSASDPNNAVTHAISKLNRKLEPMELRIQHPPDPPIPKFCILPLNREID